jgi:subtilisin family serine protease
VLRGWFALLVAGALLAGAVAPIAAKSNAAARAPLMEAKQGAEVLADSWLVELSGAPTADGNTSTKVKGEQAAFRKAAKAAGLKYSEKRSYEGLFNGFAIKAKPSQLGKLGQIPGVSAIWPITKHAIPKTTTISPDLAFALQMTGADYAQDVLGLTGAGVRVAVMDTGIDYNHPDLGGDGVAELDSMSFPTARVVTGWDFVGNDYTGENTPVPDAYPDDCNGHGTHVSGIVGASGNPATGGAKGVAPGVVFGAYRVFGCEGSTTDDIMIAAMEAVLNDEMDVLNMSIGDAFNNWPGTPTARASDRLVNKGVVVVASIGNSGASGIYSAGAPGVGEKVIGVASFDNTDASFPVFEVEPAGIDALYGRSDSPLPPSSGTFPLATPTGAAIGCAAADFAGFPAGAVALVSRGTCSFYIKAFNAQSAGAAAVVLYNNVAGRLTPTVAGSPPITIPVVFITKATGDAIVAALGGGAQTLTWTDDWASEPNSTGGLISSFSSYGLAADLSLKPDIGAPGGLIFSTYPLEQGGYNTISGTSMASPHVAGAVALLLEAKPKTKAEDVRSMLQNSADPAPWFGDPTLGFLESVHRQGAGMLDIPGAVEAPAWITTGKLSVGESADGPRKFRVFVRNSTNGPLVYDLSNEGALATGANSFSPSFFDSFATLSFNKSTIKLTKKGWTHFDVTITAPASPVGGVYGGYIVLTPQGGGPLLRLPYAGYIGDYQAREILKDTFGGAVPSSFVDTSPDTAFSDDHFTYANPDEVPWLWFHLDHQAREMVVEVIADPDGKAAKHVFHTKWAFLRLDYLARNSTANGYFAMPFDGNVFKANGQSMLLPDGDYVMKVSVLKPLTDRNKVPNWESEFTNTFTIDRP